MQKQHNSAYKQTVFINPCDVKEIYFQFTENKSMRMISFGSKVSSAQSSTLLIVVLTMYACCIIGLHMDSKKNTQSPPGIALTPSLTVTEQKKPHNETPLKF